MSITTDCKKALEGNPDAAQLQDLLGKLKQHRVELTERHDRIAETQIVRGPQAVANSERQAALEAGDVATIRKLDDEAREIAAELQVLTHQQQGIQKRLVEAKAREAVENAPEAYKALSDLMDAEQQALDALKKAQAATDAQIGGIRQARADIEQARRSGAVAEMPSADPEAMTRFLSLRGIRPDPVHGFGSKFRFVSMVANDLGVDVPQPQRRGTPMHQVA